MTPQILLITVGCIIMSGHASASCNVTLLNTVCVTPFNTDAALIFQGNALNDTQVTALCNNFTRADNCTSTVAGCSSTDRGMSGWLPKQSSFGYLCGAGREVFLANQACLGKYKLSELVNGCQTANGRATCASLANVSSCYQTKILTLPNCTSAAATFFATFQDATNIFIKSALNCTAMGPTSAESTTTETYSTARTTNEDVVPRATWGAVDWSTPLPALVSPISYVVVHHTRNRCLSKPACLKLILSIQEHNRGRTKLTTAQETPIRDIAYNFLIDPFGTIYEGVGWEYQGQHTLNLNDKSVGVAVIGTFARAPPTEAALSSLQALINMGLSDGQNAGKLSSTYKIYPHKDVECTTCCGGTFYKHITTMAQYGGAKGEPYKNCHQSYSNSIHPQ